MSGRLIPGADPGACPDCGCWRKAGMVHDCAMSSRAILAALHPFDVFVDSMEGSQVPYDRELAAKRARKAYRRRSG